MRRMNAVPQEALRLFVAIAVPETVRTEMARVQDDLRPLADPKDVRWVRPEQFHLTLKFLGSIAPDAVEAVKSSLIEACAGFQPLRLRARGMGFFPNARSPRVMWIGIDPDRQLADLQQRIERSLTMFVERESAFHAHLTLGRFQKFRRHKTEKLRALAFGERSFGEWRADTVDLMQSELFPDGSRHTVLASVRLME